MSGRIRTERPEYYEHEPIACLSSDAFRLLGGMRAIADDFGNLRASAGMLAGHVFHACGISNGRTVDDLIDELVRAGLVALYKHDGQRYAHLVGWEVEGHVCGQRVDNAGSPRVALPPGWTYRKETSGKGKNARVRHVVTPPPAEVVESSAATVATSAATRSDTPTPSVGEPIETRGDCSDTIETSAADDGGSQRPAAGSPISDHDQRPTITTASAGDRSIGGASVVDEVVHGGTAAFNPSAVLKLAGEVGVILDAIRQPAFDGILERSGGAESLAKVLAGGVMLARRRPGRDGVELLARAARAAGVQLLGEVANGKHGARPLANVWRAIFSRLVSNPSDLDGMEGQSKFSRESQEAVARDDADESMKRALDESEAFMEQCEKERSATRAWIAGEGKNRKQPAFIAESETSESTSEVDGAEGGT